ncbi:MAG: EF-hand domain-containing protein [Rhizobiales bacterium]|nr:EF-hand domain-containing protein [Hyphomicrobiales bacterium]
MYLGLASAASGALDLLSSLTTGKSGSASKTKTGLVQNSSASFGLATATTGVQSSGSGGVSQSGALSPQTLNALLAAQSSSQSSSSSSTSQSNALSDLFGLLDTNGDGQISKAEFESTLGAGGTNTANADSVFAKLDTNGDGSVSLDELSAALKGKGGGHGHHHAHGAGGGKGGGGQDALLQALDGSSSSSSANSDGSTTTTITYADGSTVTMNTPAQASSNSSAANTASSSYNLVEKLIQKQADALALSAKQSLSVSV